jgi:hypothetical protein
MKIKSIVTSLLLLVALAPQAISLPPGVTRGIYVWGRNTFTFKFTDDYGDSRWAGSASVRVYQSHADDDVPFELDWTWGVVFTETGYEYTNATTSTYYNQSWHKRAMSDEPGLERWLTAHYTAWAVPEVWWSSVYPPNEMQTELRVFIYPKSQEKWYGRDMETDHFHGWYSFPTGGQGYNPSDPGLN